MPRRDAAAWVWKVLPLAGGPAAIWGLNNQERENHPSLLQDRDEALSSPWNQGGLWGTPPDHLASAAFVEYQACAGAFHTWDLLELGDALIPILQTRKTEAQRPE